MRGSRTASVIEFCLRKTTPNGLALTRGRASARRVQRLVGQHPRPVVELQHRFPRFPFEELVERATLYRPPG